MKTQRACLGLLIALSAILSSGLASACIGDRPARAQILVKLKLESPRHAPDAPEEHALQVGDLVTLMLPAKAIVTPIEPQGASEPIVVTLEEARYLALSDQGGGTAFPDLRVMKIPVRSGPGTDLRRFGVAHAGIAYLRISHAGRVQFVRLNVAPAKVIRRGKVVRGTEATTAAQPLGLEVFDTLELELPGTPGDGWSVTPAEATGFKLMSIETVDAAPPGQVAGVPVQRVRLRFSTTSSHNGNRAEVTLDVKNNSNQFTFTLRRQATPTC